MERTKVFISYSHRDREWRDLVLEHLAASERWGLTTDATRIPSRWRGSYSGINDPSRVIPDLRLVIGEWSEQSFNGTLTYGDSGTVTRIAGAAGQRREDASSGADGPDLVFREIDYVETGTHPSIEFAGEYRVAVSRSAMSGGWFKGDRPVGRLEMTAETTG